MIAKNSEIEENSTLQSNAVARFKYKIISQLAQVAGLFFRVNIHHDDILKDLELSEELPICYVINYHSFIDLLVLHYVCGIKGLIKPVFKPELNLKSKEACYLYFYRRGLYRTVQKSANPPRVLNEFFAKHKERESINFNIVPVNIFWGRNPGKEESAFKLLFFDSENGGLIQRFFTVLFQSRRIQVRFGRSITLASMCRPNLNAEDCARKLRRICRIHFRQSRNILLGPQLYSRDLASKWVLKSPLVKEAIRESAEKNNQTIEKTQAIAAKMIWEISAEPSAAYVRFFEIILPRIFSKLYSGVEIQNKDVLLNAAEKAQIVYLPCHRSHLDYMLIGFFIHFYGLMSPHIGGGDNLNFFPVGAILRRAGAFFLRRKFGGNRLYSTIFNEYMHFLLFRGHPLAFFMEGGRSRSGRMLPPKTGMLAMVVHSYLRNPKPTILVPVALTYDKVIEEESYKRELSGEKKAKENFSQFLQAWRIFKINYGKAYIKFGDPIFLEEYFDRSKPDWRQSIDEHLTKPIWMTPVVNQLADRCLEGVNNATVISPVALLASVVLALPHRALGEEDAIFALESLLQTLKIVSQKSSIALPEMSAKQIIENSIKFSRIKKMQHAGGDVIFVEESDAVSVNYYKNNIVHALTPGALIASFFSHNDSFEKGKLIEKILLVYQFLKEDFFLPWSEGEFRTMLSELIDQFVDLNLLSYGISDDRLFRPKIESKEYSVINILGRQISEQLERYAIVILCLAQNRDNPLSTITEVLQIAKKLLDRYSLLNGGFSYKTSDIKEFQRLSAFLQSKKIIVPQVEPQSYLLIDNFDSYEKTFRRLLPQDLTESVRRAVVI